MNEQEAKDFAKENNIVFKCTSAKSSAGIEVNNNLFILIIIKDLFKSCGNKFIDPNYEDDFKNEEEKEEEKKRKQTVKISSNNDTTKTEKKAGCC